MSIYKYDSTQDELIPLAGGTLYADAPIGSIFAYGGSNPVDGFLLCQGQAVSRTIYAELFAIIGTSFGEGDGSTTFNVPDLRGEFLRGAGTNSHTGQGNGGTVGQHQDGTAIPREQKWINKPTNQGWYVLNTNASKEVFDVTNPDTAFTQSSYFQDLMGSTTTLDSRTTYYGTYTTRPTNTSVNFIIKATTITLPSDFETAVDAKLNNYVKTSVLTSWTNVTSKAVSFTGSIRTNTIQIFSNGYECKIIGELILDVAQSINQGWIESLANISINNGYRPKTETSLSGFFAANSHSPIIWSLAPSGKITGFTGTTLTEISRIPINGTWSLYN